MRNLLILTLLALATTASKCKSDPPPPPAPAADAAPAPAPVTPSCATACARGTALSCDWAAKTPEGATCLQVCTNASATVPWDVAGLTSASACR